MSAPATESKSLWGQTTPGFPAGHPPFSKTCGLASISLSVSACHFAMPSIMASPTKSHPLNPLDRLLSLFAHPLLGQHRLAGGAPSMAPPDHSTRSRNLVFPREVRKFTVSLTKPDVPGLALFLPSLRIWR